MPCAKVIRDGKVAVLISERHGSGWYSSMSAEAGEECLFSPEVVAMVERRAPASEIEEFARTKWPGCYARGAAHLEVDWVVEGTAFRVDEDNGMERIVFREEDDWIVA